MIRAIVTPLKRNKVRKMYKFKKGDKARLVTKNRFGEVCYDEIVKVEAWGKKMARFSTVKDGLLLGKDYLVDVLNCEYAMTRVYPI